MIPVPVILDTDIGGDIDDTWALAFLLRCPELDVRLVTSATGCTHFRARLIAKLLDVAGRADIPIGIGLSQSEEEANQGAWIADYPLAAYPGIVYTDGVDAILDVTRNASTPVTVISIAPGTNLAAALERDPEFAARCHWVGMAGSLHYGVGGKPGAVSECNVVSDLNASRHTFTAEWDMTLTPLDSSGLVVLGGDKYRALEQSADPLARAVLENYDAWWAEHPVGRSTTLFDTVAVYLAFASEFLVMEEQGIRVDVQGFTRVDPTAKPMRVAVGWRDLEGFTDLLLARLTGASSDPGR